MQRILLTLVIIGTVASTAACLPQAGLPATPTIIPSPTPALPTQPPTTTPVWFPPTPTFTPFPTRGVTPTADLRPVVGDLIFEDNFTESKLWDLGIDPVGSAAFGKEELTLAISTERGYLYSLRSGPSLRDFYLEITASPSLCRNADEYGLLLRYSENDGFYRFSLSCQGEVRLDKFYNGSASSPQPPILSGSVPPGAPSLSQIGVAAKGKELRFYVNGDFQFMVSDPSVIEGVIGVFARAAADSPVTVNFSNLAVYKLSQ